MGDPSIFIRLQGCPVGCEWCDAKLTWYGGGTSYPVESLMKIICDMPTPNRFVITGGEPLLYDLDALLNALWALHPHAQTQVETSGAFAFKGRHRPQWLTVSPKYRRDFAVEADVLRAAHELKFVVDNHFTEDITLRLLDSWRHAMMERAYYVNNTTLDQYAPKVYLMPEGCPPKEEYVEATLALLRKHPTWRYSARLQYTSNAIKNIEGDTNDPTISSEDARERVRGRVSAGNEPDRQHHSGSGTL